MDTRYDHLGPPSSDAGLSLVEVIVAMVLLAVVALAMVPVLVTGAETAARNREMSKASQYVATEIANAQQLKCFQVKQLVTGAGRGFVSPAAATGADGVPRAFSYYTLKDTFVDTPGESCKVGQTYTLTVTATPDSGTAQPVSATTQILVVP
ncbi:prepilin-type N-terminal cleavage/methylation domain-containing protein [Quadrisphaera setariae]|uniref:prepilin-type N-terminal cleavage/methylation domain-containing protein n=1 Tax=Quadrisphaera setariae TaxID=2593304 RepID=UPI00164FEDC0|nr:prepilin-type N-terminal cleavage/methylation domain-containing protein [Quadrisphaera setariae]